MGNKVNPANLRKLINQILITDSTLEAFCVDHFPSVRQKFSDGMDRDRKINILFENSDINVVSDLLEKQFAPGIRQYGDWLSQNEQKQPQLATSEKTSQKQEDWKNADSLVSIIERFDQVIADYRDSLDPYLLDIFNEFQKEPIERLRDAIAHHDIVIYDKESRYSFFIKTFRYYQDKKPHFVSISLPSKSYFWNDFTLDAIRNFIHSGGRMTRIFIVDDAAAQSAEAHQIMIEQLRMGVSVFTTHPRGLSRRLRSTFPMIDPDRRIAWEVHVKENTMEVQFITVTTNPLRIAELEAELHHIHKIPYVPPAHRDDVR